MEDLTMMKPLLEIGIAGGIAFYLLSRTTEAIKELSGAVKNLAESFEKLNTRIDRFESDISEIKFTLRELIKHADRKYQRT